MRLTVVSGKGGVGKSMVASSLAILFSEKQKVVAVDCDVDAPNLALWLGIDTTSEAKALHTDKISTVQKPIIDHDKCTQCGKCVQDCSFRALRQNSSNKVELIQYKCEGCGLCEIVCPVDAIKLKSVDNCTLSHYETSNGFPVIQGQIEPGEAESGEAVTEVRKYAGGLSKEETLFIQDAAAGIGCPVIASIVGSDYVIAVAEPSKSSFSDLKRVLKVVDKFKIPFGIVINKYDLNKQISDEIKAFANKRYLGSIKYRDEIIKSIVKLKPVIDTCPETKIEIQDIYNSILKQFLDIITNQK
jgi:MinD superfamily P-loop ATPase